MLDGLKGLNLVLCWMIRRIQPLQHRPKLMCQYDGTREDALHSSKDNLSSDSLTFRLKDMVRIRDKIAGYAVSMKMFEKGKIPAVISVLHTYFGFILLVFFN